MADRTLSIHSFEDGHSPTPQPFPVSVVSLGNEIRDEASYRWNNRRHTFQGAHVFQYTLSGVGTYSHWPGGKKSLERLGRGQMFLASHDRSYEYACTGRDPWEFVWITLRGAFVDQVCRELWETGPVFSVPPDSAPITLLRSFLDRLDGPFVADPYALTAVAYDFLVQLLKVRREESEGPGDRFAKTVRELVLKNLKTVDVELLAARFGYSPKYFITLFGEKMHTTPNRYILLQKMKYASLLLSGTRKSIGAIADEVGFAEDNYFSKVFRKLMGSAPSEYREKHADAVSVDDIVVL